MWPPAALGQRSRVALVALGCTWLLACDAASAPPQMTMPPPPKAVSTRAPVGGSVADDEPANAIGTAGGAATTSTPPPTEAPSDAGMAPVAEGDAMAGSDAGRPVAGCLLGTTRVTSCPLPASQCSGESILVFFENARCVDGRCSADAKSMRCPTGCSAGSCGANLTLL
jgi:hypothetical protein